MKKSFVFQSHPVLFLLLLPFFTAIGYGFAEEGSESEGETSAPLSTRLYGPEGEFQDLLPVPPEGKDWELVWNDEFNGTQIDESKWEAADCVRRDGFWSPRAISLDGNGLLKMTVFQDEEGRLDRKSVV